MGRSVALLVALASCGRIGFSPGPGDAEIDVYLPLGPFGPAQKIDALSSSQTEANPTLTGDRLELYFFRFFSGDGELMVSRRASTDDPWGSPAIVTELSSGFGDTDPEISSDGLTLYLTSDRAGNFDVYRTTRPTRADPWAPLVRVDELSSTDADYAATPDGSDLRLVMSSLRGGTSDIYLAERADRGAPWSAPQLVPEVSSSVATDATPFLARGGRELVFMSTRPGSQGHDLYLATRATPSGPFDPPVLLDSLATPANESGPWLSEDGRYIVFQSDRGGAPSDLYEATR